MLQVTVEGLTMALWKSGILVDVAARRLSRRPHDAWNAGQFVDRRGNKDFGEPPIHRPRIVILQHHAVDSDVIVI